MRCPIILCAASVLAADPSGASRFEVGPESGDNRVVFVSKAPLESFEGKTARVIGSVVLDPATIGEALEIRVQVAMASLDTGIGLRNRHMRENHLHTDRFPHATFTGGEVLHGAGVDLRDGRPHEVLLRGQMELHGVRRAIEVPLRLTYRDEGPGRLQLWSEFEISLSDYEIPRPRFLMLKLGEVQKVRVDLTAVPVSRVGTGGRAVPSHRPVRCIRAGLTGPRDTPFPGHRRI